MNPSNTAGGGHGGRAASQITRRAESAQDAGQRRGHARDMRPGNEGFVTHEQVVDPEVDPERILQHRQQCEAAAEEAGGQAAFFPAQAEQHRREADEYEADRGIGWQRGVVGPRLHQENAARPPAAEHQ